jgi:hypothetical protein
VGRLILKTRVSASQRKDGSGTSVTNPEQLALERGICGSMCGSGRTRCFDSSHAAITPE